MTTTKSTLVIRDHATLTNTAKKNNKNNNSSRQLVRGATLPRSQNAPGLTYPTEYDGTKKTPGCKLPPVWRQRPAEDTAAEESPVQNSTEPKNEDMEENLDPPEMVPGPGPGSGPRKNLA